MANELVTLDLNQLPSTQVGNDSDYTNLAQAGTFLSRLQLYTKGKAVNNRKIGPGEWGIPEGSDEITRLGDSIDVLVMARRPKAIDISDTEAIEVSYDPNSDLFKAIAGRSEEPNSGCMYGPSFLVFERTTGRFLEYFCGTKSARAEAGKIYPFCPLTPAQIEQKKAQGVDVTNMKPHGPLAMTLKTRLVETKMYSWHVAVILPCSTPFTNTPSPKEIIDQIARFVNVKDEATAVVAEETVGKRRAR